MSVHIKWLYFRVVHISLIHFLSNGTAKTKLAILAFLYCAEFVKTLVLACDVPFIKRNICLKCKFPLFRVKLDLLLKACSHDAIVTAIYLSQLKDCSHGVIVTAIYLSQLM